MKTPSHQEAAKMTNREIAEKILGDLTRFVVDNLAPANFATMIERALNAKDLEADKNGYERGRKDSGMYLCAHHDSPACKECIDRLREFEENAFLKKDEALLRECWSALETMGERHGDCPDKRCGHNFVCDECVQVANTASKLKSRLT